ncbi:uncharacterized protein TRUGW13939_04247 [Talaromyces rugulosus]|uniref:Uncharacterized protein n=1 Tax=Talaromyces rugulosus TaxID=121627 RepID=A0A7H8QT82_TALRU|nr:uncharacterized protein TRUGW13939_04247 [Talaromyces rugulosus]QKX57139.1 hypothetical protein TRUGW13939_04247 [Talaromyces rugulosus]
MPQDVKTLLTLLRTPRVNTLTELRRIERNLIPAKINPSLDNNSTIPNEIVEPLASAWLNYVYSNNLLSELRNLTRSCMFSSELLDEAKMLVTADPDSGQSWNFAWLVLNKIENEELIDKHARDLSTNPDMWGGRSPAADEAKMLEDKCKQEWTWAVRQMLRNWETA